MDAIVDDFLSLTSQFGYESTDVERSKEKCIIQFNTIQPIKSFLNGYVYGKGLSNRVAITSTSIWIYEDPQRDDDIPTDCGVM